jgi:hypothetical protein
LAEISKKTP